MADVANVISGPATLFVAPDGTAIPTLTGNATDFAAFSQPGYTDKGIELDSASTDKDIDVVSITNTNHCHALATIWAVQAGKDVYVEKPASHEIWEGYKMISVLLLALTMALFVLGIMGPAPTTLATRQIIIYRAIPKGTVKMHYQRKDKLMYAASFQALGLSTLAIGSNLCTIQDF